MKRAIEFVLALALLITCWGLPAVAQDGLALMKVESGARPSGMGGAFVSMAGDPLSSTYNPAGAVDSRRFTVSFGHNQYWENIRIESGFFSAPMSDKFYLHGGIKFAAIDELEERTGPTSDPDAYFDAHDVSLKAGLAYRFSPKIAAGMSAGWFIEEIGSFQGSAFNVDLGLVINATEYITLGGSASILGSGFTLDREGLTDPREISLPTTYRFGGSYKYRRYLGAADLVIVDDETHLHLGVEASIYSRIVLRSGYMFGYDVKNFSAGASFLVPRYRLNVDYGFVPYSEGLGTTHLFNLTVGL